ncbi:PAS domain S-box protein [Psychroflexus sp. C1]|uniref:histidine kinase n=2 Tax=Psychroflexus maritimus TaxID=2714865 RepID=A0A967ACT0_9FLAO|nr:PAS domain S-box protein [Psychroflexus maritimus]
MMTNNSTLLLELTFSVRSNLSEQYLLHETLIFYVKKLNCQCAFILPTKEIELSQSTYIYPKAFRENRCFEEIKQKLAKDKEVRSKQKMSPSFFKIDSFFIYIYTLSNYGNIVLVKTSAFPENFENELIPVFQFYGDTLLNTHKREYRTRIEQQLLEERLLVKTILDHIPIRINLKNNKGKIKLANKEELAFHKLNTETELIGKNEDQFYSEETQERIKLKDQYILHKKQAILNKEIIDRNNRHSLISKLPFIINDNEVEGIISLVLDISNNKKKEKDLNFFQSIINQSSDAIFLTYENGSIYYCNTFAYQITGIKKDEINQYYYQDIDEDFKNKSAKKWQEQLQNLLKQDTYNYKTNFINLKTKERTPLEIKSKLIEKAGVKLIVSIGRDISEKIKNEKIIEEELKFQNLLLKISSTYINTELHSVEEIIQQSLKEIGEFVKADRSYIFEYDLQLKTSSNTYEWCAEGVSPEIENLQNVGTENLQDWLNKHERGKPFFVDKIEDLPDEGEMSVKEILSAQGIKSLITIPMIDNKKLIGFVGFDSVNHYKHYSNREKKLLELYADLLVNIEKRKKYAFRIKEQEERFQSLIKSVDLNLIELDRDFKIVYVNENFVNLYAYTNSELIGKNALTLFLNDQDKAVLYEQLTQMNLNQTLNIELTTYTKHKKQKIIYISIGLKLDERNNIIGYIGAFLDITQKKQLEADLKVAKEKAEAASKEKDRFLANMSHEIRTPLNIINGAIAEISKTKVEKEKDFLLEQTKNASEHLLSLVNNVLDMAKINANEMTLKEEAFDLEKICHNSFSILANLAKEKGLNYQINFALHLEQHLVGDATKLSQVIINLLNNAVKYTEKGDVVFKITKIKENKSQVVIEFEIADTGIGMSAEFLNLLFNEYTTEQHEHQSTGLGMTISKRIINLMNSEINIDSIKNKGTKVSFQLAFHKSSFLQNTSIKKPETSSKFKTTPKVLIVEDNKMNTLIVKKILERNNFETLEASNGEEALSIVQSNEIDLILMDIQMPVMDGIECTKIIRDKLKLNTPIIALTANVFKGDLEIFLKHGMNDFLTKPFKEKVLIEKCTSYLQRRPNKKEEEINTEFNLDQIKELTEGNKHFEEELITTFLDIISQTDNEFESLLSEENYEKAKRLCHKIKPSLIDFSLIEMVELSNEIMNTNQLEKLSLLCKSMKLSLERLKKRLHSFIYSEL